MTPNIHPHKVCAVGETALLHPKALFSLMSVLLFQTVVFNLSSLSLYIAFTLLAIAIASLDLEKYNTSADLPIMPTPSQAPTSMHVFFEKMHEKTHSLPLECTRRVTGQTRQFFLESLICWAPPVLLGARTDSSANATYYNPHLKSLLPQD